MSKTLQQLAQDALLVQDACNLSGVATSFAKVVQDVRAITPNNPDWHCHPILKLWADKIASLVGTQFDWDSGKAYDAVRAMAANETVAAPSQSLLSALPPTCLKCGELWPDPDSKCPGCGAVPSTIP